MNDISVDKAKCILCNACVDTCPAHIFLNEGKEIKTQDEDHCIGCGHCAAVCPVDAVLHSGLDLKSFIPGRDDLTISPDTLAYFLRSRRSCRAYLDKEVSREVVSRLIDIARYAPTGHNAQNVSYTVVQDKSTVKQLSGLAAEFYGNLAAMIEKSPDKFPPTVRDMAPSFRRNYEFFKAGKDRIFRGAPAVVLTHAPAESPTSIDNCQYAAFHVVLMAHAMGLGSCINRYFVSAAEFVPDIMKTLKIPAQNKIYGCVTLGWPAYRYEKLPSRKEPQVTII